MLAPIRPKPTIPMRTAMPPGRCRHHHGATPVQTTLRAMIDRLVLPDPPAAARAVALRIAAELRGAIALRGRASLAVSGGTTPWLMLADLAAMSLDWEAVDILQVDERVAPDNDPHRNLTHLRGVLDGTAAARSRLHPMDVGAGDADAAAIAYRDVLRSLGGPIDVVHLGLGPDGHTASLAPGDAVLDITDVSVAATSRPFNGHMRVTLTYPALDAARAIVWLVAGDGKGDMPARMEAGDTSIPAGRVSRERAVLVLDRAAAGLP